jgi:hypothetical protein
MAMFSGNAGMSGAGMEYMIYAILAIVLLGWLGWPSKTTRKELYDDLFAKYLQRISAAIS